MSNWTKFILLITSLACALSIAVAVKTSILEQETYQKYVAVKRVLTQENFELRERLEASDKAVLELESQLQDISERFNQTNQMYAEVNERYKTALSEKDRLNEQLNTLAREKISLEGRLREVESDIFVGRLLKGKAALELKIKSLQDRLSSQELDRKELLVEKADLKARLQSLIEAKQETEEMLSENQGISDTLSQDLAREKKNRLRLAEKLEKEKTESDYLQSRMHDLNRAHALLENKLAMTEDKLAMTEENRNRLTGKVGELNSTLEQKLEEIKGLKSVLAQLETRLASMKDRLKKSEENKSQLAGRVSELDSSLKERLEEIEGLRLLLTRRKEVAVSSPESQVSVELAPIVVRAAPYSTKPASLGLVEPDLPRGKILTVNKEYEFVVIDLGEEDGIKAGMPFTVYRGDKEIGRVEILEVHPGISAADIKSLSKRKSIRTNDIVVLSK
jgi:chromosome segregation ATPase